MNPEIDISQVILHTARLTLRPWLETDLEDFYTYASVDGVGQMAGWTPHRDRAESRQILGRFFENKRSFALEYQGKVIGSLGIEAYNEAQFPELRDRRGRSLGYVLSKDYWGQGLMPEAGRSTKAPRLWRRKFALPCSSGFRATKVLRLTIFSCSARALPGVSALY